LIVCVCETVLAHARSRARARTDVTRARSELVPAQPRSTNQYRDRFYLAAVSTIRSVWRRASIRTRASSAACTHRVSFVESRRHAAPATRQPATAGLPRSEDAAVINNMGLSERRRRGGRAPARRRTPPACSASTSPATATARSGAEDFVGLVAALLRLRRLSHARRVVPEQPQRKVFLERRVFAHLMARLAAVDRGPLPPSSSRNSRPTSKMRCWRNSSRYFSKQDRRHHHREHDRGAARDAARQRIDARRSLGPPLFARSTAMLAHVAQLTGGSCADRARRDRERTTGLRERFGPVRLRTTVHGPHFGGTALVTRIKRELAVLLMRDGYGTLSEAVGTARSCGK